MGQPYQRASQAIRQGEESAIRGIQSAALTAAGGGLAAAGSKAVNALIPRVGAFLSNYVPEGIAIKGLNKINPRLGSFVKGAMDQGYSFDDVKNFLGEKIEKTQDQEKKIASRNLIEEESPELHRFLEGEINGGQSPVQAGALAQMERTGKGFKSIIEKLEKKHKIPWSQIIQMAFGVEEEGQQQAQQSPDQPMQPQGQPQSPQQAGQGSQALMAILQKIQQVRGQ